MLPSVACLTISSAFRLPKKRQHFRRKVTEHKTRVFFFSLQVCLKNFSLQKKFRYILSQIYICFHVKCPLFLSHFNEASIFSTYLRKMLQYQISWKSVQWEPRSSMRAAGRTNGHGETNICFSQFCEHAYKNAVLNRHNMGQYQTSSVVSLLSKTHLGNWTCFHHKGNGWILLWFVDCM